MGSKKTAHVFVGLASLKSAEHEAGGRPGEGGKAVCWQNVLLQGPSVLFLGRLQVMRRGPPTLWRTISLFRVYGLKS